MAMLGMIVVLTFFPTSAFESFEVPRGFRYESVLEVVVVLGGVVVSLALFTVLVKWCLAGERAVGGPVCFRPFSSQLITSPTFS